MIREINLDAIAPVAAALEAQDVGLAARPNTPLAEVMTRSFPFDESQVGNDPKATLMSATALMTDEGAEGHSLVVDQETARVSEAIVRHVKFARNVVLPIIGEVYAEVREEAEESGPIPFNVDQVWLHDAVTSPLVQDYTDRYDGQNKVVAPLVSDFPERTEEQLVELINTGSASYDSVLADLLSRVDIVCIYDRYFRTHDGIAIERLGEVPSVRFGVLPMSANDNLIVHLLSRALMDSPHEGSGKSMMEHRTDCAGYIEASGCALNLILKGWDRFLQQGVLVLKQADIRPSAEKTIYVYGPVYQQFLEKDGSAEAIIGAAVTGQRQLKYLAEFVEALPKLKIAYANWLAREDNTRLANSGKIIKAAALDEIKDQINDLEDANNVCGCSKEQMHRAAVEIVDGIPESEWIKAPYQAIRIAVCRSMFPTSNAFRILTMIDEQTEKHQLEDVRLAAYHAIKQLLVEHFLTQVVKVG